MTATMTMMDMTATTISIKIMTKTNNCATVSFIDDDGYDIITIIYKQCCTSMCMYIFGMEIN